MNTSQNIVLIPAYEPGETLLDLLDGLSKKGCSIVVIDDGSGPAYSVLFAQAREKAVVLTHKINLGKGAALKTGFDYISRHCGPDCVIVTVDADGQHRVDDAMKICRIAHCHPDTLVLGSRTFVGNIPLRSRAGNTVIRFVYRLSTGLKVYDTQTGLRAFHRRLLQEMPGIPGDRYEYEMNVLLKFARSNIPIMEEEIETIYLDNNSSSHFNTVRDSWRVYKEILRFSASSLTGFAVDYLMYSLLILTTGNLRMSNIVARIVSAGVNYTINRKFVFKSDRSILRSALSYFLLAAFILTGNTIVLEYFVNNLGINRMAAKVLTEILFFTINWIVQRSFIFKKGGKTKEEKGVLI